MTDFWPLTTYFFTTKLSTFLASRGETRLGRSVNLHYMKRAKKLHYGKKLTLFQFSTYIVDRKKPTVKG